MPDIRLNARDYISQVASGGTTPTWATIPNVRNFSINEAANLVTAETTDFDDAGNYREEVMQRGAEVTLETFDIVDSATGVISGALARLDALSALSGYESTGSIRFRHKQSTNWIVWQAATFKSNTKGGSTNDKSGRSFTITRGGPATVAAVV